MGAEKLSCEELEKRVEELEKAVALHTEISSVITELFIGLDENLNYTYMNKAYGDYTGADPASAIGKSIYDVLPGLKNKALDRALAEALKTRTAQTITHQSVIKDAYLESSIHPIEGGLAIISKDITSRKKAEAVLKESEERYRTLAEAANDFIYIFDYDGFIHYANGALARQSGRSQDELIGMQLQEVAPPEPCEVFLKSVRQVISTGEPLSVENNFEFNGREVWLSTNMVPLRDQLGEVTTALGISRDITKHMRAELDLQSERSMLKSVIGAMRDGLTIRDLDYRLTFQNDVALKLFGDQTGNKCYKIFAKLDEICEGCPVQKTYEDGGSHTLLKEVPLPNGELSYWENTSAPIMDGDGKIISCLEISKNVTERVRHDDEKDKLQRQLLQAQKMESIGHLAGGIAHDFNNMLGIIMSCAQLAMTELEAGSYAFSELQTLMNTSKRAKELVQKLLAFARKEKLKIQPVSINELVAEVADLLDRSLPKKINVVKNLYSKEPTLNIDRTQLEQAILNICNNSADAMPDGGTLTIETNEKYLGEEYCRRHEWLKPGRFAVIIISDTGTGVPEDMLHKIFDPFLTTKGVGKGTGLGLAVTHGIVRSHGGHISIHSELGKGTMMKIYLPYTGFSAEAAPKAAAPATGGAGTVLLVDDERELLSRTAKLLKIRGFNVIEASGGWEAKDRYAEWRDDIDVVVLDFIMPEMDGSDVYAALREIDPEVKVIIASGYFESEDADELIKAGVKSFVQKPFDIDELSVVIRGVIDGEPVAGAPVN